MSCYGSLTQPPSLGVWTTPHSPLFLIYSSRTQKWCFVLFFLQQWFSTWGEGGGLFCPTGNIWQCVETFLGRECYCHSVGRARNADKHLTGQSPTKKHPSKMSVVPRLRKPSVQEQNDYPSTDLWCKDRVHWTFPSI